MKPSKSFERGIKSDPGLPGLGVYLHIPFCAKRCDFCAFYEKTPRRGELADFISGLECELALVDIGRHVDTVFWGGGTPGLLPARDLETLGRALRERIPESPEEWTVEMAPSTVKPEKISVLKDLGVNRISLGVETFSDKQLEILGRQHLRKEVYKAIDMIYSGGVEILNLDLMFAIPGQTLGMWEVDLREAVEIGPQHISTYCLTYEEDTALYLKLQHGRIAPKGKSEEAAFYESTWRFLRESGYTQYEIANFARNGFQCLHNINTWRMGEWIGFGPSAASQVDNRRYTNIPSLAEWLIGIDDGKPVRVDEVDLTPEILAVDCLIFGLRMNRGVDLLELSRRFPSIAFEKLEPLWKHLHEEDLMSRQENGCLRLTPKGRLLADSIAVEILHAFESYQF